MEDQNICRFTALLNVDVSSAAPPARREGIDAPGVKEGESSEYAFC
jgi:hypothetical protein